VYICSIIVSIYGTWGGNGILSQAIIRHSGCIGWLLCVCVRVCVCVCGGMWYSGLIGVGLNKV
jgi:hypothetical protein